jgi:hypothetical protein
MDPKSTTGEIFVDSLRETLKDDLRQLMTLAPEERQMTITEIREWLKAEFSKKEGGE